MFDDFDLQIQVEELFPEEFDDFFPDEFDFFPDEFTGINDYEYQEYDSVDDYY